MFSRALQLCAAAGLASATNLFVASYAGNITTLSLTESNGHYSLNKTYINDGCSPNPSWLTLDVNHGTLYCLDEGLDVVNGTLSSFKIQSDGQLDLVQKDDTINGPVSGVIYGNPSSGKRAIALAHYVGSALSTWSFNSTIGGFARNQEIVFNMSSPGPNADRQEAPHEHEAILDPTGQYILVPDLGMDQVHVFSFDAETLILSAETPLKVEPGSGPRHAVFYNPYGSVCENCTSYLMLVTELGNTVTSYRVTYPTAGGMAFEQVYNTTSYGDLSVPEGNAAAEIVISPDNRFLLVSNRNNTSFSLPNPDSSNSTAVLSDSMATFELNYDGSLTFRQLWPVGGSFPRQFSVNKFGDLVAVGMQESSEVVILSRDVVTGNLGKPVARIDIEGQITNVMWHE